MAYTRPTYNADNLTWQGESIYTRPAYNSDVADFSIGNDIYDLSLPIEITVIQQLKLPVQVTVFDLIQLNLPVEITVVDLLQLTAPVEFIIFSRPFSFLMPVAVRKYEVLTKQLPVSITVKLPSIRLAMPASIQKYETIQFVAPIRIQVAPTFASGTGGQGVGRVVGLPTDKRQNWTLKVLLNDTDVSNRLTGTVNIDAEESSAAIAVFTLKPAAGLIDPYSWVKAKVQIFYTEGEVEYLVFQGVVDTPVYDTTSRLTEYTCTDDLQNVVMALDRAAIDALTPQAKWSRFVFAEDTNTWDYLQDRLSTYKYAIGLDLNRKLEVYEWDAKQIQYEFNNQTILDGSISINIANTREITNQFTISLDTQYTQFRETVATLTFNGTLYTLSGGSLQFFTLPSADMILSAVNGIGSFIDNPSFLMNAPSHNYLGYNITNPGTELLVRGFIGKISKRFTQNITNKRVATIRDSNSISQLGILGQELSAGVESIIDPAVEAVFNATFTSEGWLPSAANTWQNIRPTNTSSPSDPQMFVSDGSLGGWIPYPMYPVSATFWEDLDGLIFEKFSIDEDGNRIEPRVGGGEVFYDFSQMAVNGSATEQIEAYEVLKAQAKQTILATHRQNRISFTTFSLPLLKRGMTVRVATTTVIGTGILHQLNHVYDIDQGSALTNITLAISSSKAIGISESTFNNIRLRLPTLITVQDGRVAESLPVNEADIDYGPTLVQINNVTSTDGYTFGPRDWGGFFNNSAIGAGFSQFVVEFPELPEENTDNSEVTADEGVIEANVPNDEFYLFA